MHRGKPINNFKPARLLHVRPGGHINSISELKPGDTLAVHIHHGIESAIVLQGGMIQVPGKDPTPLPTGVSLTNLRNVPHGGWKVVGDSTIRLFTVHIVDKGKPLYDAPSK